MPAKMLAVGVAVALSIVAAPAAGQSWELDGQFAKVAGTVEADGSRANLYYYPVCSTPNGIVVVRQAARGPEFTATHALVSIDDRDIETVWSCAGMTASSGRRLSTCTMVSDKAAIVERLMAGSGVTVRFEDAVMSFPLRGSSRAITQAQSACPDALRSHAPVERAARSAAPARRRPAPAQARTAAPRRITFREIHERFGTGSRMTELQKDRAWEDYEGKCVEWTGELVSLSEGWFGGFTVQFKHLPTTFASDVVMSAPSSAEAELLTWSIGTRYTYRATLAGRGETPR